MNLDLDRGEFVEWLRAVICDPSKVPPISGEEFGHGPRPLLKRGLPLFAIARSKCYCPLAQYLRAKGVLEPAVGMRAYEGRVMSLNIDWDIGAKIQYPGLPVMAPRLFRGVPPPWAQHFIATIDDPRPNHAAVYPQECLFVLGEPL